ncbi:MAG: DUF4350 domain-containing protein [Armatimonadetes bacterium]|nr:DUF4350 domain-containing protein [Armatimonadota bacterium]
MKGFSLRREYALLVGLMLLLLITATLSREKSEEMRPTLEPSTFNARPNGLKALYLLYETQGHSVVQFRSSWRRLNADTSLLFAVEPFDKTRPVSQDEMEALKLWVEAGGTFVYIATAPTRGYDPKDPLMGDISVVTGDPNPYTVETVSPASPTLENVTTIAYTTPVRLKTKPESHYTTLLEDRDGTLLLEKKVGRGHLYVSTVADLASNSLLAQEKYDNLPLLLNIAKLATHDQHSSIAFDEYHHGIGFEESAGGQAGVWSITPLPLRLLLLHSALVGLLLVYSSSRRFGQPISVPSPKRRPSTDYATAVAGFWKKSKASDIAFLILYDKLLGEIAHHYFTPDSRPENLLAYTQTEAQPLQAELVALFAEGERIRAGKRISERELLTLIQRLENVRRAIPLVG